MIFQPLPVRRITSVKGPEDVVTPFSWRTQRAVTIPISVSTAILYDEAGNQIGGVETFLPPVL